jgi:hypothetical protein
MGVSSFMPEIAGNPYKTNLSSIYHLLGNQYKGLLQYSLTHSLNALTADGIT